MKQILDNLGPQLIKAVADFWKARDEQKKKQARRGGKDQGARSAVTGGAQMDGFISLIHEVLVKAGAKETEIFQKKTLELPGYFRPTKEWDLLLIKDDQLIVALEAKSQVGPSFGNNFNNRTEEAMGSALDLWTAYREGAFNRTVRPWLGYFFLLEDCEKSRNPVKVKEPHFKVFPEFKDASYSKRFEIFCRKLVRERHYSASSLLLSNSSATPAGFFSEPASDLTFELFIKSLLAQVIAYGE